MVHGRPLLAIGLSVLGLLACSSATDGEPPPPEPQGVQRPPLCARPGNDSVRDVFCAETVPDVQGLADLYRVLGAGALGRDLYGVGSPLPGAYGEPPPEGPFALMGGIVVTIGHSTALSGRVVSPINPRVIVPAGAEALIAFQRGVQKVEIAAVDRDGAGFVFYLATFRQACNGGAADAHGCAPGDLYTPSLEAGWTSVTLQDDEELKNTPSDCRQCHRRTGDRGELIMRELFAPWTHFFSATSEENGPLLEGVDNATLGELYRRAKGAEAYAGVPAASIDRTSGFVLQSAVPAAQSLFFDSPVIFNERFPYTPGADWPQPPVRSATWDREFEAFKRGEHLPLPHFDLVVADREKLAAASTAYRRFLSGELDRGEVPDLSDVFSADPRTRAEIGLETDPEATPAEALVQACGTCHNDILDQSISRARFNIGLSRLSAAEIATTVERLRRDPHAPGAMPPPEARRLSLTAREQLIDYLERGDFSADDIERLDHAAAMGMAGNTTPAPPRDIAPY